MPCPLILLDFIILNIFVMKLLITQFSPTSLTSSLFGHNILNTLSPNTISPHICSSLNVRNQVSHPYRTAGKIIVSYILFLDSRQEYKRFWTESPLNFLLNNVIIIIVPNI
jgi:hypothetical protein